MIMDKHRRNLHSSTQMANTILFLYSLSNRSGNIDTLHKAFTQPHQFLISRSSDQSPLIRCFTRLWYFSFYYCLGNIPFLSSRNIYLHSSFSLFNAVRLRLILTKSLPYLQLPNPSTVNCQSQNGYFCFHVSLFSFSNLFYSNFNKQYSLAIKKVNRLVTYEVHFVTGLETLTCVPQLIHTSVEQQSAINLPYDSP